ncbi:MULTISPECIES: hypothetical protein [unclassified Novosphingobium]|uniref:hypothetical protein n=1 Tax=unclassified Novosphingobium TaxID=2644732 RepID=UPI000D4864CB|nr:MULTISPECIES: hypothetical protein [unclassified Novosphingobium]PTR07691.1 hypothetical protein C8K11_11428 [Novosphingobium sp. GV055]PUB00377.1 hypothetical protein C8K12_11428 [Novosphingobium sp. GV061]PUB15716.1 hypothetical protein C8K14_11428 [Novosphingobium sp. GV079]PUB39403.1 hypothetical protein C8K10_11428 [Novosphingobium sp. GV027]
MTETKRSPWWSRALIAGAVAAMPLSSSAQTPPAPAGGPSPIELARYAGYFALPDLPGTGPMPAIVENRATLPNHLVYRPASLPKDGSKLGVLLWGNSGCSADAASARLHLLEIASHGYVAIAPGTALTGPDAPAALRGIMPDHALRPVATMPADILKGLDWILAENARPESDFYGRIDPRRVAVSGHSCGGVQALDAASDPRVHAVIIHNSGIFPDGKPFIPGLTTPKQALERLHTPVLYIMGGPGDIAYDNGMDDFRRISRVPVAMVNIQLGHRGSMDEPYGGRVAQVALDWLDWQLDGNAAAGRTFTGPMCRLCVDPAWTVQRKGF